MAFMAFRPCDRRDLPDNGWLLKVTMPLRSYQELVAWQKSMTLVADIYRCTQHFPKDEIYGLSSQIRRAAISIPSNIAEGQGRLTS